MNPLIGPLVGAALSVIILSYLIGDNFLYRIFTHVLVGVGSAYIVVSVVAEVLKPQLWDPLWATIITRTPYESVKVVVALFGLLGCVLLFLKTWPRLAGVGNIAVGYLVGVGAAVALGGALFGTFSTQIIAATTVSLLASQDPVTNFVNVLLVLLTLLGTLTTLLSFGFYRTTRGGLLSIGNATGRIFLSVALGATFALVYVSSVSLLIDRVQAIVDAAHLVIH